VRGEPTLKLSFPFGTMGGVFPEDCLLTGKVNLTKTNRST
jgi:hypothetical protein